MWGFSLAVAHWLSKHQEKIQAERKFIYLQNFGPVQNI